MRRRFEPFLLDTGRCALERDGRPVELQPKALDLLVLLSGAPDHIFTKEELLTALWPGVHVSEASLHQALRKARRALGDDPDAPRFVEAVSRRGWRWIAPIEVDDDGLLGRAAELATLSERLVPGAVVLLHGPGGVGKTRLAREHLDRLGDAVLVDLRGCADEPDVLRRVAAALGVPLEAGDDAIGRALAASPRTLSLDDAEAAAEPLGPLLARWRSPTLRILVTSRVLVAGADVIPVPPLGPDDAGRLLLACHGAPLDPLEVAALIEPLEGLPLAIELTARRLRLLRPAELAARLHESLRSLSSSEGRSLWASLRTSWALLAEADRHLLAACALFPGPFAAADVEPIGGDLGDALDGLERLVDASLVRADGDRFAVGGLVREFARDEARREGYGADRVAAWVRGVVARVGRHVGPALRWDPDALAALRDAREEVLAALRSGVDEGGAALAVALALGCRYGGPWDVADRALAAVPEPDGLVRLLRAEYAIRLGRTAEAVGLLEEPAADRFGRAFGRFLLARLRAGSGDLDGAESLATSAASDADDDGNPALAALALDVVGAVHGARGDAVGAARCYDAALSRVAHRPGRLARLIVAQNEAASLGRLGRDEDALLRLEIAAEAADALPMPHLVAVVRANLATALLVCGRIEEAAPLLASSLEEARRVGDRTSVARHATDLALACALGGDGQRAEELLDEATAAVPAPSHELRVAIALRRAWAARARGERRLAEVRDSSALALDPEAAASVDRHPKLAAAVRDWIART